MLFITTLLSYGESVYGASAAEIQQWLQAHNQKRTLHGVPNVSWSTAVEASAQAYANTCPSGHSGTGYGENLAFASNIMSLQNVVNLWYNEEPLYDYNNPGWNPAAGHFTQVVWKSTTLIGCGYRTGCAGAWPNIWVCQYNPAGNFLGQFSANVFPPVAPPQPPPPPNTGSNISHLWPLLFADKVVLNNSSSVGDQSWVYYVVTASSSYSKIKVELYNISSGADIDLYVRNGTPPTVTTYNCRPWNNGTSPEECVLDNSGSTSWHVGVYGFTGPGNYTVKATLLK